MGYASDEAVAEETVVQADQEQDTSQSEWVFPDQMNIQNDLNDLDDLKLDELLSLMYSEKDDNRYCQLARILLEKGNVLKMEGDFDKLFPILLGLLNQNDDMTKSSICRDSSLFTFQQLALGEMAEHLLNHLEDRDFGQKELVYHVLNHLGGDVVDTVIKRFLAIDNQFARKSLMNALLWIGFPAISSLVEMLMDSRWQVVRTAVAILGEMGNRDAVKGLTITAYHNSIPVRMETVRSLAKIGGREATELLINLLQDNDQAIRKQAIVWMGNTRNQKALNHLMHLVNKRDVLAKTLDIKKEALLAIGRIGDREALDPLFRFVNKRHWIVPGRQEELKIVAIEAIGHIGGESSREFLEKLAGRGGRIARACSVALETMGQRTVNSHE
jgi:HEAT repeat protein